MLLFKFPPGVTTGIPSGVSPVIGIHSGCHPIDLLQVPPGVDSEIHPDVFLSPPGVYLVEVLRIFFSSLFPQLFEKFRQTFLLEFILGFPPKFFFL